jgi:hypothetical protein
MRLKKAIHQLGLAKGKMSLPFPVYVPFWRLRAMVFN